MPSALSHPAVPLALALGSQRVPGRQLIVGVIVAVLPDADALGLRLPSMPRSSP
jgi:hypothetical protein